MEYIKVRWLHKNPDEPILLYSELDDERWETRKLEIFRDGRICRASSLEEAGGSRLGVEPVPSLTDINGDPEFQAESISESEFDCAWQVADGASLLS